MVKKLDLHRCKAENCIRCHNTKERESHKDPDGYCILVEPSDHLGVRCVGDWGADKVVFVSSYMDITGVAMKFRKKYTYYIEICSGPGRCVDFVTGEEVDGTSLASLSTKGANFYTKIFFFDLNPKTVENLRLRIDTSEYISQDVKDKTIVSVGDYTNPKSIITVLEKHIPRHMRGLNVVFVDPTDMSVPFDFYSEMMKFGNDSDFIINFAHGTDLKRNIMKVFKNIDAPSYKKYSKVLRNQDFFTDPKNIESARKGEDDKLSKYFEDEFIQPFKEQGYIYIQDTLEIKWFYKLLYLSKVKLGKEFWEKACVRTAAERENCQSVFNFD